MPNEVDVDQAPTSWRESGTGPVALFLHGLGGSRVSWRPQFETLTPDRHLFAWDAPGYGMSEPISKPTFDSYAERAAALIDVISPRGPVDLVGMSFGGMIAQYVAACYPGKVRSLTLLCTSPKFGLDGTDPESWQAARLNGLRDSGSPAAAAPFILASLAGPSGGHVVPEAVAAMARIPMAGLLDAIETIITHDTREILPTIYAPTLVLVGGQDTETPTAYGQAIVDLMTSSDPSHQPRRAELRIIDGAGHLLNLEAPDQVNAAIHDHWSSS